MPHRWKSKTSEVAIGSMQYFIDIADLTSRAINLPNSDVGLSIYYLCQVYGHTSTLAWLNSIFKNSSESGLIRVLCIEVKSNAISSS